MCSYLPGTIGDKCEELVDKYGEKLIDALVKEEMDPKKVTRSINEEVHSFSKIHTGLH